MNEITDMDWTLHLFRVISKNGNVNELLYGNYDLSFLMRQMRLYVSEGLLMRTETGYKVTETGENLRLTIEKELGYNGIYKYIMHDFRYIQPQLTCSIADMSESDIYIPRKRAKKGFKL